MLAKRIVFGATIIAVLTAILFLDDRYRSAQPGAATWRHDGVFVTVVLSVVVVIGTIEMCRLAEAAGHAPLILWAAICNYLLILVPYLMHNGLLGITVGRTDLMMPTLVGAFLGTCLGVASRGRTEGAISNIAVTMLIILYAGLLPSFILRLRLSAGNHGVPLLVYFLAVTKCCDIGAYFTGRAIGRHKLIEWLSPKKTIEGLAGGVAFSMIVALALSRWSALYFWPREHDGAGPIPPMIAAAFGATMALVGQGGDLLESLFKRDAQAKDSAHLLPEFGGILDLIDSLLPTAPIACLMLLQ